MPSDVIESQADRRPEPMSESIETAEKAIGDLD